MREIKFRAWDNINAKMIYEHAEKESFTYFGSSEILQRFNIVMQFTGLIDKNGKEIYEGDIVATLDNHENPALYQIKWRHDVYMIAGYGGNGEWLYLEELEGCEIIGNIYETPELLK